MINIILNKDNINKKKYIYFSAIKYEVLKYIVSYIVKYDFSPTYLDVARKFNFSRARAGSIIRDLFRIRLINKGYSAHRNIRMTNEQINNVSNLKYNREYEIND